MRVLVTNGYYMKYIMHDWSIQQKRTRQRRIELLGSVGLTVTNFYQPDGYCSGIVEAKILDMGDNSNITASGPFIVFPRSQDKILDLYSVSELCKGCPVYRYG